MEKQKHDLSLMTLSATDLVILLFYYTAVLLVSLIWLGYQIATLPPLAPMSQFDAITALVAASSTGSAIYYSRKLYKAAINSTYNFGKERIIFPARVGTLFFFLLRPLFAATLSIVVYALWRVSLQASTGGPATPRELIFIVVPMGFFAGFSAGRLLEQFQEKSLVDLLGTSNEK